MSGPKDDVRRKIGSKGRAIVHYVFNADHWDYKEETGGDVGRDCIIELSENDEWLNHKIEGQIKARSKPQYVCGAQFVSYPMEVKTIEYALGASNAFVLFVVDAIREIVYFQCIQDYFMNNRSYYKKLDQSTINIRIPLDQELSKDDSLLQSWARTTFIRRSNGEVEAVKV